VEKLSTAFEKCCAERSAMMAEATARMIVARNHNSSERYLGILWGDQGRPKEISDGD
jgi:hypothetical protein